MAVVDLSQMQGKDHGEAAALRETDCGAAHLEGEGRGQKVAGLILRNVGQSEGNKPIRLVKRLEGRVGLPT